MIDNPMNRAPLWTARSKRTGVGCKAPAVRGHRVCRFHGARGGAPKGAAHGLYRHGRFTCEAIEQRREIAALIAEARRTVATAR